MITDDNILTGSFESELAEYDELSKQLSPPVVKLTNLLHRYVGAKPVESYDVTISINKKIDGQHTVQTPYFTLEYRVMSAADKVEPITVTVTMKDSDNVFYLRNMVNNIGPDFSPVFNRDEVNGILEEIRATTMAYIEKRTVLNPWILLHSSATNIESKAEQEWEDRIEEERIELDERNYKDQ